MTLSGTRVLALLLALVAGGLVLWLLWPEAPSGPRDAIERRVVQMTRAAEERDLGEVLDGVSERFRSPEGWDKREVGRVVAAQVLRGQWVRIFTTDLSVREVSPTRGEFQAKFIFGRSEAERLEDVARDSALSAYLIEGTFEREEDGEWRVTSARHRRLSPSELL